MNIHNLRVIKNTFFYTNSQCCIFKFQVVFFMYLWSIDIDAVLTAMSCFHLLCEEAEIRCGCDEMAVTQLLPNYNVYSELAAASTVLTTGKSSVMTVFFFNSSVTGSPYVVSRWFCTQCMRTFLLPFSTSP